MLKIFGMFDNLKRICSLLPLFSEQGKYQTLPLEMATWQVSKHQVLRLTTDEVIEENLINYSVNSQLN